MCISHVNNMSMSLSRVQRKQFQQMSHLILTGQILYSKVHPVLASSPPTFFVFSLGHKEALRHVGTEARSCGAPAQMCLLQKQPGQGVRSTAGVWQPEGGSPSQVHGERSCCSPRPQAHFYLQQTTVHENEKPQTLYILIQVNVFKCSDTQQLWLMRSTPERCS